MQSCFKVYFSPKTYTDWCYVHTLILKVTTLRLLPVLHQKLVPSFLWPTLSDIWDRLRCVYTDQSAAGTPVCPISEQIGAKWSDVSFSVGMTARGGTNLFVQITFAAG